ncbi:hypothetical protein [Paenibacillus tyrfis]|uniref:hypothetical protein n=1 Tax=Paenibacillus tyrfis TaxID=1501230 RepID=UPI000B595D19|nr:hypothetical protein [Paenibacillus tyrfis]
MNAKLFNPKLFRYEDLTRYIKDKVIRIREIDKALDNLTPEEYPKLRTTMTLWKMKYQKEIRELMHERRKMKKDARFVNALCKDLLNKM